MKLRQFAFIAALLTAASIAGSGARTPTFDLPADPLPAAPIGRSEVVDLNGLRNIAFGDTEVELTRRGILRTDVDACGTTLAGHDTVSPIFADDRLVLLWLGDTGGTPEGVTTGTPVTEVRARYPAVRLLRAPKETYRFDGLLARRGDRAYLFLHDGKVVRKVIAGYAEWAERLFADGHSPC